MQGWKGEYGTRMVESTCKRCGTRFRAYRSALERGRRYCSHECSVEAARVEKAIARTTTTVRKRTWASPVRFHACDYCGEWFTVKRTGGLRYCTPECRMMNTLDSNRDRQASIYELTRGIGGTATRNRSEVYRYLHARDGGLCAVCFQPVELGIRSGTRGHDHGPSIEHLIPRSHGGSDDLDNLALSHWGCNRDRRTKDLAQVWEASNG